MTDYEPSVRIVADFPNGISSEQQRLAAADLRSLGAVAVRVEPLRGNAWIAAELAALPVTDEELAGADVLARNLVDVMRQWKIVTSKTVNRAANPLHRGGVYTLGDAFLMGREDLLDLQDIGPEIIRKLAAAIKAELGDDVVWPAHTNMGRYAQYCYSLEQLNAARIDLRLNGWTIGRALRASTHEIESWTARDSWDTEQKKRVTIVDHAAAASLYQQTEAFATTFLQVRKQWVERRDGARGRHSIGGAPSP